MQYLPIIQTKFKKFKIKTKFKISSRKQIFKVFNVCKYRVMRERNN